MELEKSSEERALLKGIGKALIALSVKRRKSLERIAYEAGVSKGYIYDIAKGRANPSMVVIHRLSSALDLSVSEFLKAST